MKLAMIRIQNFRKLKNIRLDFSDKTTLFVGANNSGKTSAMDSLRKFLIKGDNRFLLNDFTITNRNPINKIGNAWEQENAAKPNDITDFLGIVPTMDVWIDVKDNEFHYVSHLIPTLDWKGGLLGVRLSLLPKGDGSKLFEDYITAYKKARETENSEEGKKTKVNLYPLNLCEYLERNLNRLFEIKAFILDPAKVHEQQDTELDFEVEEKDPFDGLIRIDMIDAQRGFADADSTNDVASLSTQFRTYYDKHLDIEKATTPEDMKTLEALRAAKDTFDETLGVRFKGVLDELGDLGYPGVNDPKITIESKFEERKAFDHDSAIHYDLTGDKSDFRLPEKYNGLGYQNLIAIVFRLISFRDARLQVGKAKGEDLAGKIPPLHLVLLEEPEAHLHVQVQQVLINKAYDVLTKSELIKANGLATQLIVSTHSSHVAKETEFCNIRYFKRVLANKEMSVPTSIVINLTDTFGKDEQTMRFVQRYIQVTHCDLFFADAVIFVEGTSENVFMPYFISTEFPTLTSRYLTILPVGGAHSHKFKPLIEKLKIPTLIITDLDPKVSKGRGKVEPKRNENLGTLNSSIKKWGITETTLDKLLDLPEKEKLLDNGSVRVAYQTPITIKTDSLKGEILSSTFEDSLIYTNMEGIAHIRSESPNWFIELKTLTTIDTLQKAVYEYIHDERNKKVSFALELLYTSKDIKAPEYIAEGLAWLSSVLESSESLNIIGGVASE